MGAAASPGVAAAAHAASPNEIEGVLGGLSNDARLKLGAALTPRGDCGDGPRDPRDKDAAGRRDSLFERLDANKDGVIDAAEWARAKAEQLIPAGGEKPPLVALLDSLDVDGAGRLDAGQVTSAVELFNALDKPEPLRRTAEDDEIQRPKVGADGKVGRRALEALIILYAEGPPSRPMEQVVAVFQEMYLIKELFAEWADGGDRLHSGAVHAACAVFDKWAYRAESNKDSGRCGTDLTAAAFTKWAWQELKALEEKASKPFWESIARLRESMRLACVFWIPAWAELISANPQLLGPVLAACDGLEWEKLQATEQQALEAAAAERCGLAVCGEGRVEGAELQRWAREEVIQLPVDRIADVAARLEAFVPVAVNEETYFRVTRSFRKWDTGGHGTIASQDLCSVMAKVEGFTPEEMDALMCGVAPKADGRVDYTEFAKWVTATP